VDCTFTIDLQLVGIFFSYYLKFFFHEFHWGLFEAHRSTVEEALYWDGHGKFKKIMFFYEMAMDSTLENDLEPLPIFFLWRYFIFLL